MSRLKWVTHLATPILPPLIYTICYFLAIQFISRVICLPAWILSKSILTFINPKMEVHHLLIFTYLFSSFGFNLTWTWLLRFWATIREWTQNTSAQRNLSDPRLPFVDIKTEPWCFRGHGPLLRPHSSTVCYRLGFQAGTVMSQQHSELPFLNAERSYFSFSPLNVSQREWDAAS